MSFALQIEYYAIKEILLHSLGHLIRQPDCLLILDTLLKETLRILVDQPQPCPQLAPEKCGILVFDVASHSFILLYHVYKRLQEPCQEFKQGYLLAY